MANITVLEALQLSLNATKKYVDDKVPHYNETLITEISGEDYNSFANNSYFNMSALNIDETKLYVGKEMNSGEKYSHRLVYDKEADALICEDTLVNIYNHKSYDGTSFIDNVNSAVLTFDITPMSTVFEGEGYFRLYEVEKLELDNNCLSDNVSIVNSLTVGTRIGDIGGFSVSEGDENTASGYYSHAEGSSTTASGLSSHAEGTGTTASGNISHAEGFNTTASGYYSHAEGSNTTASGILSHTEGLGTKAKGVHQHVQGKYNIEDTERKYAHIVGNGTSDTARSNAHTLDWNGNAWYKGKLSQDGVPTEDKDLTTKKYVDEKVAGLVDSAPEALNTLNELATALGNDANFATTISNQIGLKANSADLATVATSGDYNDLTNKPTIPSEYSLPVANQNTLGGIKVGAGLSITADGILSATGGGTTDSGYPRFINGTILAYVDEDNILERSEIQQGLIEALNYAGSSQSGVSTIPPDEMDPAIKNLALALNNVLIELRKTINISGDIFIPGGAVSFNLYVNSEYTKISFFTLNKYYTVNCYLTEYDSRYEEHSELMLYRSEAAKVALSGSYNDLTDKPTIPTAYTHPATHPASMITGLSAVATSGSYADLGNKPTIPTVTNDLTNALKSNYDTAYTHSQSAHAPSNAQKNSDITKAEIEAKLTGDITSHTHNQYLTEHQDISGLAPKANPLFIGNATVAGKVTVGTAPTEDMDVATKQYVDNAVAAADYGPYSIRYNSENNRLEFIYTPTN